MAVEVPHLLSAVLALAAAHRQSSGLIQGRGQVEFLKGKSLTQLRSALNNHTLIETDNILATTLVLCMAEVISPDTKTASWRSHLFGAAALSARTCPDHDYSQQSSTASFLRRKFRALQAIAFACDSTISEGSMMTCPWYEASTDIDDLAGYSTRLMPIFKEINALGAIHKESSASFTCDAPPGPPHFNCNTPLEHQSHLLFDRTQDLMAQRELSRTTSHRGLSQEVCDDFYLLDESYHHMAILQIFRWGSLSIPYQLIETSKHRILTCLASMTYKSDPCPGVAALPPLFVAASFCSAAADRDKARHLLRTMWMNYSMGNVRACWGALEKRWIQEDTGSDRSAATGSRLYEDLNILPY